MADETDKERADRLEQECEELTELLHFQRIASKTMIVNVQAYVERLKELDSGKS